MNNETNCVKSAGSELAERYITGRLSADAAAAYEDHFVGCTECQRENRLAAAVSVALATHPAAIAREPRRDRSRTIRWIGIGLAAAAGMGAIAIMRSKPSAEITQLGAVLEPPVYLGVAVRGRSGPADSIFDEAMNAYGARRYADAAAGLRHALVSGQDSSATEFFLGASLLMANDLRGAAAAFDQVLAKGDSSYRDEAQLYMAKALLRAGRGREALEVLARRTPSDAVMASSLAALADSIRRTLAR